MINLKEVANKISDMLNSVDNPIRIDNERVIFEVATEGYRMDSIDNRKEGKNVIPVFVGLNGGENNPIPNLKQQSKNIGIAIYYQIIYKDILFDLEDYLNSVIVGKTLNIGTLTGNALANMSIVEYGEITGMDLQQFKNWVSDKYAHTFSITANWMSLSFSLYLTQMADGFMFGNDISYSIKMEMNNIEIDSIVVFHNLEEKKYDRFSFGDLTGLYCWRYGTTTDYIYTKVSTGSLDDVIKYLTNQIEEVYDENGDLIENASIVKVNDYKDTTAKLVFTENMVWQNSGTGVSISPISQQLINKDSFAKNVANITNYNKSLIFFVNPNTDFGKFFMTLYNLQKLDYITNLTLYKNYSNGFKFVYNQLTLNINENADLGSPLSFTITLGDKA